MDGHNNDECTADRYTAAQQFVCTFVENQLLQRSTTIDENVVIAKEYQRLKCFHTTSLGDGPKLDGTLRQ